MTEESLREEFILIYLYTNEETSEDLINTRLLNAGIGAVTVTFDGVAYAVIIDPAGYRDADLEQTFPGYRIEGGWYGTERNLWHQIQTTSTVNMPDWSLPNNDD